MSEAKLGLVLVDINAAINERLFSEDTTPYMVEGLASAANHSVSDVEEALTILEEYKYTKREQGSIILQSNASMDMLPKKIRLLMNRAAYPEPPTKEEKIMAYLLLNNATVDNPISIPNNETVTELYQKGDIKKVGGGCYLTEYAEMATEGLLELIPEMKSITMADLEVKMEAEIVR